MRMTFWAILLLLGGESVLARTIQTNQVRMEGAPSWLTEIRVQKVGDRIQDFLEWDIRRVSVKWYETQKAFQKYHGFDSSVLAVSSRRSNSIHIGPGVNSENFDMYFGHELAHVVMYQKYKKSIPQWLEEGLANYAAGSRKVDFAYLKKNRIKDIRMLTHPFDEGANTRAHYMASTALALMISEKCDFQDLLQLSVGKRLETYLKNTCGIQDLNASYGAWVASKK